VLSTGIDRLKGLIHSTVSLVETSGRQWTAVEEDFVLLEVAEGCATGSGPSESSYSNYGILYGVEWSGVEGSGSSERSLRVREGMDVGVRSSSDIYDPIGQVGWLHWVSRKIVDERFSP
jgi:hypothetical protein